MPRKVYSDLEKDFLLKKHDELQGNFRKVAQALRAEFKDKADVTNAQLKAVYKKYRDQGGEPLQKKGKGHSFSREEFEFLIDMRMVTDHWPTIGKSFRARFTNRTSTARDVNCMFLKLRRGKIASAPKDLQQRAAACPKSFPKPEKSGRTGQKVNRTFTKDEDEWVALQWASGKLWKPTVEEFHRQFPNPEGVDVARLKLARARYLRCQKAQKANLRDARFQTTLLNRAELDIVVLQVHRELPDEEWKVKAARILDTEAYKKFQKHVPKMSTEEPVAFQDRKRFLEKNEITIAKLEEFLNMGSSAGSDNPYENAWEKRRALAKARGYGSKPLSKPLGEADKAEGEVAKSGQANEADEDETDTDDDGDDDGPDREVAVEGSSRAFDGSEISELTEFESGSNASELSELESDSDGFVSRPAV